MRAFWLIFPGLLVAGAAVGQNAPVQSEPLPPLQRQWQQEGSPPVQQAPTGGQDQQQQTQGLSAPPPASPPAVAERPNAWVQGKTVKLQALDKVNAQSAPLTINVGQSATYGSLNITAKACVFRPSDQPADAAAFLSVTDSHQGVPGFDGWLLEDEPSMSMMQNPIYDLRVVGCT